MRRPSPFSASTRAEMTFFFAQSTTPGSENVVLSMILHGPHHAATTSSMTGLFSAFARRRTSANGLPSMNGTCGPAGVEDFFASEEGEERAPGAPAFAGAGGCLEGEEGGVWARAAGEATRETMAAAMSSRSRKGLFLSST